MNILFTNMCNLRCAYCFARGQISHPRAAAHSSIPLGNLKKFLDFAQTSSIGTIGILGGEPTLHPRFVDAFKMVVRSGLNAKLFTNGTMPDASAGYLANIPGDRLSVILNVNELGTYSRGQWSAVEHTMETLSTKIMLSHTIAAPGFSGKHLIALVVKHGLKRRIRLGISAPLLGASNAYVCLRDHKTVAKDVVAFARKCDDLDIAVTFDCGFRLCSFTQKQLGELQLANAPLTATCGPVIDVGTDLRVWRCFSVSHLHNRHLREFSDVKEIEKYYHRAFSALSSIGPSDDCRRCRHFKRRQCAGGCLGHTLKSFNQEATAASHYAGRRKRRHG